MNHEVVELYDLFIPVVCYGMLTGGFLRFLKAHFKAAKINQGLFIIFLFTGFMVTETFCERGICPDSLCRLLSYLLFAGLVILVFEGPWEKKLLAVAILITVAKLVTDFCASFLSALILAIRHGILKQSVMMLESWQESLIIILSYLITGVTLCFLAGKSRSLFLEKTGKWYLLAAGPLFFIISVVDAYNWSVGRGVLFWGGERLDLYENQLFSHGAVCVLTAVCMFAAGFYIYGMEKIYEEWQKKEQYRLRMVYLEGLREQNERMDKIRHDMKNHIISLQGLLASGNLEKLGKYLDRIAETGGITGAEEITGNQALDALLYEKRKQAEEKNIVWKCDMQPWKKCALDEFDFCVLAGNGLDNAIEACERMEDKTRRFIHIQTGRVKNYFLLEIKNSTRIKDIGKIQDSDSDNKQEDDKRAADKWKTDRQIYDKQEEIKLHGIGLLNIKETVEKYNGIMSAECEDGVFVLSVLIPVKQPVPEK